MDVAFGTSGIRGVVNEAITAELALKIGRAIVKKKGSKILVARDTRESGVMLEKALASGVISSGGSVIRAGIMPTPTTAIATKERANNGVMITASHNPPEYNGFKFFDENGKEISSEEEKEMERKIKSEKFISSNWDEIGEIYKIKDAIERHMEIATGLVDCRPIARKKPKVIVDCGNGTASLIAPYVMRDLGCKIVGVNCEPTGIFSRSLEPNAETLSDFSSLVKAMNGDIGIAYDGDGDRAIILDENGELLGLDQQLSLMCKSILEEKRKATIVSTIEASLAVRETIEKKGGKLLITRVGSRNVAEVIKYKNAVFGGEPCGEYIFPEEVLAADGILASLKFIELFCKKGKLSRLKKEIKSYPIERAKFKCANKYESMEKIKEAIKISFKGEINEEDGIRVDFDDGWLLVRASGTEPAIRLTAEHKNRVKLKAIYDKAAKIIEECIA